MPGFTHLQTAQPVLLAHHLLAYFEMLQRDTARFRKTPPTLPCGLLQGHLKLLHELTPGDFPGSKLHQVVGGHLAVDQIKGPGF